VANISSRRKSMGSRKRERVCVSFFVMSLLGCAIQLGLGAASRTPVKTSSQLPVGLILPVRLQDSVELKNAHKGTALEGRIAQDVPVPGRDKIKMKAVVKGSVLRVTQDSDGVGVSLTMAFTQIEDHKLTLTVSTSLRAIASYEAVRSSQTPWTGADTGSPSGWANTTQIGGDIRYGDGGPVRNAKKQKIGKGVIGGVLVHVAANPARGCAGPAPGEDYLQALWVFSADACGPYSLKDVKIVLDGTSDPVGEVTLHFPKSDMKLEGGTAFLLQVVERP
jgi:hypothetical protein